MVSVGSVLRHIPDPRGRQEPQHPLEAVPGRMLLCMLSGCKGLMAAFCPAGCGVRGSGPAVPRELARHIAPS